MLNSAVLQLHELTNRPGQHMVSAWWQHLDMQPWQRVYQDTPTSQRAIDRVLASRRGSSTAALPNTLNTHESTALALWARLPKILTALGLLRLGRTEYLLLGPYRRALESSLDEAVCAQVLALRPSTPPSAFLCASAWLEPEQVLSSALAAGIRVLDAILPRPAVRAAFDILWAPDAAGVAEPGLAQDVQTQRFAWGLVTQLGRVL